MWQRCPGGGHLSFLQSCVARQPLPQQADNPSNRDQLTSSMRARPPRPRPGGSCPNVGGSGHELDSSTGPGAAAGAARTGPARVSSRHGEHATSLFELVL